MTVNSIRRANAPEDVMSQYNLWEDRWATLATSLASHPYAVRFTASFGDEKTIFDRRLRTLSIDDWPPSSTSIYDNVTENMIFDALAKLGPSARSYIADAYVRDYILEHGAVLREVKRYKPTLQYGMATRHVRDVPQ